MKLMRYAAALSSRCSADTDEPRPPSHCEPCLGAALLAAELERSGSSPHHTQGSAILREGENAMIIVVEIAAGRATAHARNTRLPRSVLP
jgi:hypothetical protein